VAAECADSARSKRDVPSVEKVTDEDSGPQSLTGWGRTIRRRCEVRRPTFDGGLVDAVLAEERLTVRGAGKSYGDAALPGDGVVLDLTAFDRIV
jgi:decaprenylphospho-beta-D-ribofuranose 2-oxidase